MSRRRLIFLLAVWALGLGVVLGILGWWVWKPLLDLAGALFLAGIAWMLCLPLVNRDPIRPAGRRYLRAMLPAMGGYVLATFVLGGVRHLSLPTWSMVILALLPVVPMVWVGVAMWRLARDSDELERRVQLESVFVTCGVVGVLAFAAGMLEMAGVLQLRAGLFYVLPAIFLVYAIAHWWCGRQYGIKGLC